MMFFLILMANLGAVLLLIAVHETGHHLAGWAAGIPRREMRVRLLTFPQHVVLQDGTDWVAPFDLERYLGVMQRHLRSRGALFLYTAGGLIVETIFTVAVSLLLSGNGWTGLAQVLAGQSLAVFLIYTFLMDLPRALQRGYPWGDVSGLWFIARAPTLLLVTVLLAIRAALLWSLLG